MYRRYRNNKIADKSTDTSTRARWESARFEPSPWAYKMLLYWLLGHTLGSGKKQSYGSRRRLSPTRFTIEQRSWNYKATWRTTDTAEKHNRRAVNTRYPPPPPQLSHGTWRHLGSDKLWVQSSKNWLALIIFCSISATIKALLNENTDFFNVEFFKRNLRTGCCIFLKISTHFQALMRCWARTTCRSRLEPQECRGSDWDRQQGALPTSITRSQLQLPAVVSIVIWAQ